ncbi:MAG: serine/threonine protein kinase, partial [Planctomycetes bacterium]|nr:serine/threonine protein kinase [Planctomycetota bacterium]
MHDPRSTPPDSGVRRPEAGDRLGRYRVLARLGAGAVGEVYRVEDEFGRQLALKLFTGAAEEERLARFAREGEVTATLRHSGIVGVHGAGVEGTSPYLVYELVEGEDLECAWRRLSRERLLQVVLEVADALGYAHARGVVHRDLKPANVLLDRGGRARVADFGLAQVAGLERLTRSGAAVGTPHYMSPEQATGARERYGPHSDVWALGVVLYRALCGRLPFDAQTLLELMVQIGTASPPPPGTLDPTVSPALEAVCLHALAREPEDRYPHAA